MRATYSTLTILEGRDRINKEQACHVLQNHPSRLGAEFNRLWSLVELSEPRLSGSQLARRMTQVEKYLPCVLAQSRMRGHQYSFLPPHPKDQAQCSCSIPGTRRAENIQGRLA